MPRASRTSKTLLVARSRVSARSLQCYAGSNSSRSYVTSADHLLTYFSITLIGDKEAKAEEKKKQDTVDKIMSEMWKYSQTYEYAVVDPSGQTKKESAWCKFSTHKYHKQKE